MKLTNKKELKRIGNNILDFELNQNIAMLNGNLDLAFEYKQKARQAKKDFYKKSKQSQFNRNLEKEIIKKFGKSKTI